MKMRRRGGERERGDLGEMQGEITTFRNLGISIPKGTANLINIARAWSDHTSEIRDWPCFEG